jgi:hypothetical protein
VAGAPPVLPLEQHATVAATGDSADGAGGAFAERDASELAAFAVHLQAEPAVRFALEQLDERRADLRDAQPVGHQQPDDRLRRVAVVLGSGD